MLTFPLLFLQTVEVILDSTIDVQLSGANLNCTYVLEQFHVHWGTDDDEGSEHQMNSDTYPMEVSGHTFTLTKYPGKRVKLCTFTFTYRDFSQMYYGENDL